MIALDDDAMTAVMDVCRPLRPSDRDQFVRALAAELEKYPEVGPGLVHRIARDLVRRYFDPPNLSDISRSAGKYA
jgi:hypothetical protein